MPGTTLSSITTFGDLLKHLRRRARLTQRELGIAAGYSEPHMARLEGGQRLPDLSTVRTLMIPALGLDKEPVLAARLLELAEAARAKSTPGAAPTSFPTADEHPNNLPAQLTTFIGRQQELAEVKGLLCATRLLTITGSAGAGKTRLAIQAAADMLDAYPDGVWLVELATLSDPALLADRLAVALGPLRAASPANDVLAEYLRDKYLLIILDNCEHLVGACAEITERLLRACLQLHVLATSREALNIPGETVWRIPALATAEAVQIFADRARAARPGFALTAQNTAVIAQICDRLDGMPLAIELAAARLRVLPAEQIAQRLDDRFILLTGGARTALPRHQTLRTLIDWSYDLLSEPERLLLARLSVFSGGWTLEAAEAVCASAIMPLLFELASKSLVLVDERVDETRYRLLETVREYGLDKLRELGELSAMQRRHAQAYLDLAEQAEAHLHTKSQKYWFDRLTCEHDNIRAALTWSQSAAGDCSIGLRLAGTLWKYWLWRSQVGEGRRWLEELLRDMPADAPAVVRAQVLLGACALALSESEQDTRERELTAARLQEALKLFRNLDNPQGVVISLCLLGNSAWEQNDLAQAQALYEQSLAVARQSGHPLIAGEPLERLANLYVWREDWTRAIAFYEEYLTVGRKTENDRAMAEALIGLGMVALRQRDCNRSLEMSQQGLQVGRRVDYQRIEMQALMQIGEAARYQGDFARAKAAIEELRAGSMRLNDEFGVGFALQLLGKLARDEGYYPRAHDLFADSLAYRHKLGGWSIPYNLEGLASVAGGQGQAGRAARLFGAAEAIRECIHWPLRSDNVPEYERQVAAVRAQLDAATFDTAWTEGRALTAEQAVAYALAPVLV